MTLRIGRYFPGSAGLVDDLLFHVQGSPGESTLVHPIHVCLVALTVLPLRL